MEMKEKKRLEKIRSSSVASFCLHPSQVLSFWIMTLLNLFILSPMLWNIIKASGIPIVEYATVNILPSLVAGVEWP